MELTLDNHHPRGTEAGCRTCGRIFSSDRAFDQHRTGTYEGGRKCAENLSEAGLELDPKGRWRRPKYKEIYGRIEPTQTAAANGNH